MLGAPKAFWGLCACLVISTVASGQGLPEREFGEPWNGVPFGVRALGMGGAYTAVSDDLAGIFYNPGALIKMQDTQFGFVGGNAYFKRKAGEMKFFGLTMPHGVGNILSGMGGFAVATTIFKPWVAGLSRVRIFHPESVLPWQEDFYMGTFAMPLNTPRTSGLGVNVKFLRSSQFYDRPVAGNDLIVQDKVSGWAVDVGMVYNIPMPVRDRVRELSLGMMARNIVGRKRVLNRERTMPAQILLGIAYSFDDFIPRERSVLALNYDQALRGTISGSSGQLRVGFEQWFFSHFSALRLGYAAPLPDHREGLIPASLDPSLDYKPFLLTPPVPPAVLPSAGGPIDVYSQGRPVYTMGLTAMLSKFQVDVGVTIPAEVRKAKFKPGLPETPILERFDDDRAGQEYWLPTDTTRFYFQVTYHFWSQAVSPLARVTVEPLVFTPKRGEVGVFNLEASDKRGIEVWELMIKNSARVPVRTYSGKGMPPRRLVWDGLDDRFNLVPDDDHTYTLRVRNADGMETTTAPQAVRIFAPADRPRRLRDPALLYKILEETERKEQATKAAVNPLIMGQLKGAKEPLAVDEWELTEEELGMEGLPVLLGLGEPSSTVAGMTQTVTGKPVPEAAIAYRDLEPQQILRVQVPSAGRPDAMITEYETQEHIFKYLAREIRNVTLQNYAAVGPAARSFMVQARYGNHLLIVETPMEVARGLQEGRLTDQQWLNAATITLDKQLIQPKLR